MFIKLLTINLIILVILAQYCPSSDVTLETNLTHAKAFCKSKNVVLYEGIPLSSLYEPKLIGDLLKGSFDEIISKYLLEKERKDSKLFGENPIIYHNIFEPYNKKVFTKLGNPPEWNEVHHHPGNPWNGSPLIRIGAPIDNTVDGILINIPEGYELVWIRIHNQYDENFKVFRPSDKILLGVYGAGNRKLNSLGPEGTVGDRNNDSHYWIPIPSFGLNQIMVAAHTNHGWISGLAFTKNPYDYITNSGNIFKIAANGGDVLPAHDIWWNDQINYVPAGQSKIIKVPIIPTNQDKLIYLVEQNDAWQYNLGEVVILSSGRRTRFSYTYQNAFQTHFDGKIWNRFAAFELFASEVPKDNFLDILIVNKNSGSHFYWREFGSFNRQRKN